MGQPKIGRLMRIAVMSDIHGFSIALEHVLAEIDRTGPFDEIVVAGDLCEVGPGPEEVLSILQSRAVTVIQGNTDFDIVEAARMGADIVTMPLKVIDQLFNHPLTDKGQAQFLADWRKSGRK